MLNGIYGGICLAAKKYEIDMSSGSLVKSIIAFVIPLMLSNILQLLYNAADIIVVGQFTGKEALAAVGSTGPLINLLTNLFIGLSERFDLDLLWGGRPRRGAQGRPYVCHTQLYWGDSLSGGRRLLCAPASAYDGVSGRRNRYGSIIYDDLLYRRARVNLL